MPQPRSSGSRPTGSRSTPRAKSTSSSARPKRAAGSASTASKSSSTARKSSASRAKKTTTGPAVDERLEAAAQRVRKLNERIIDAGKTAGEDALNAYEKALKSIASGLEKGPGKSDVEWFSNLATAQAKFIRDVTDAWTKAARDMLKK
jgi:hypothetical protein